MSENFDVINKYFQQLEHVQCNMRRGRYIDGPLQLCSKFALFISTPSSRNVQDSILLCPILITLKNPHVFLVAGKSHATQRRAHLMIFS